MPSKDTPQVDGDPREELADLNALFDLRWKADMRAIQLWQAAGTGRELTWPDHADLCVWLLNLLDLIREEAKSIGEDVDSPDEVKHLASRLGIAMIADPKMIPIGDRNWTSVDRLPAPPAGDTRTGGETS